MVVKMGLWGADEDAKVNTGEWESCLYNRLSKKRAFPKTNGDSLRRSSPETGSGKLLGFRTGSREY